VEGNFANAFADTVNGFLPSLFLRAGSNNYKVVLTETTILPPSWGRGHQIHVAPGYYSVRGRIDVSPAGQTFGLITVGEIIENPSVSVHKIIANSIYEPARDGDLGTVNALLRSNPALVFRKDKNGSTPLAWAVQEGLKDVAELLLVYGADVNAKDNYGNTPLHWSVKKSYRNVSELLRQHGGQE
jgi:ankyrin repeat protein